MKLQKPKKNIAADRLKRLQTNLKSNQLKAEAKTSIKKPLPEKKLNVTPPTSLKVMPPQSATKRKSNELKTPAQPATKRKSNELVTPKKPRTSNIFSETKTTKFIQSQTSSPLPITKKPEPPSPKLSPISKNGAANSRLKELQKSLEKQQSILPSDDLMQPPTQNSSLNNCSEEMDWEPSDFSSSCVSEITENNNDKGTMSEYYEGVDENSFKISSRNNFFEKSYSSMDFHFVVDTNVLLNNLTFIKDLSEKIFAGEFSL